MKKLLTATVPFLVAALLLLVENGELIAKGFLILFSVAIAVALGLFAYSLTIERLKPSQEDIWAFVFGILTITLAISAVLDSYRLTLVLFSVDCSLVMAFVIREVCRRHKSKI